MKELDENKHKWLASEVLAEPVTMSSEIVLGAYS